MAYNNCRGCVAYSDRDKDGCVVGCTPRVHDAYIYNELGQLSGKI